MWFKKILFGRWGPASCVCLSKAGHTGSTRGPGPPAAEVACSLWSPTSHRLAWEVLPAPASLLVSLRAGLPPPGKSWLLSHFLGIPLGSQRISLAEHSASLPKTDKATGLGNLRRKGKGEGTRKGHLSLQSCPSFKALVSLLFFGQRFEILNGNNWVEFGFQNTGLYLLC